MKAIVWTFLTLAILASLAGPAAAFDAKTFFEAQDRSSY
jgi:hypothetical protein